MPIPGRQFILSVIAQIESKDRATTNERKRKLQQKQGGEGAAELLPRESPATASLISKLLPTSALICRKRNLRLWWKKIFHTSSGFEMHIETEQFSLHLLTWLPFNL